MINLNSVKEEYNSIPNILKNSWWKNDLDYWSINSGEVTVEEDSSGFSNLTMDSKISSQVIQKLELKSNHAYFLIFDVKVTRYVQGVFGVYFNGRFKNSTSDIGLRRISKNQDYETVISRIETTEDWNRPRNIFVGSIGSANGSGQIRKMSLYDLTELYGKGNEPSVTEFYQALPSLQDAEAAYLNSREVHLSVFSKKRLANNVVTYSQGKDPSQFFVDEMNKKAKTLGMSNTKFKNCNGFRSNGQVTTVRDFLKLGLYATGFNELLKAWGKKEHEISIKGENSRTVIIESTVQSTELEDRFDLLGGKTGTINSDIMNAVALVADSYGDVYLSVVLGASGAQGDKNRFLAVRALVDIAQQNEEYCDERRLKFFNIEAGGIIKIPNGNPFFYSNKPVKLVYGINEDKEIEPASIVKVMTAVLLLENTNDLNQYITLLPSDILGGSGPKLMAGDRISFLDLLHLMMLPSSNTAAKAISRVVGERMRYRKEQIS